MTDPRAPDAATDLRDARLHKALAHAPDYDALPAPATRKNIKNIANNTILTIAKDDFSEKIPWWEVFWKKIARVGLSGRTGTGARAAAPWNAAFATLLISGIITLIWQGQPVPDAVLDEQPAAQRPPDAVQTAPATKPAAKPAAKSAVSPADKTPAPAAAALPTTRPEPALAQSPQPGPLPQDRDPAAPVAAQSAVSKALVSPAAPALRREASAFEKRESATERALGADKLPSDMAAVPQQARTQGATAASASPALPSALQPAPWTEADMLYQGRTTRLARRDAQNLVNRAVALALASAVPKAGGSDGGGDGGPPLLRLQLLDQGNPLAVAQFELSRNNAFRWQRSGQADVASVLTPEAVAGLLAEAARALPP